MPSLSPFLLGSVPSPSLGTQSLKFIKTDLVLSPQCQPACFLYFFFALIHYPDRGLEDLHAGLFTIHN